MGDLNTIETKAVYGSDRDRAVRRTEFLSCRKMRLKVGQKSASPFGGEPRVLLTASVYGYRAMATCLHSKGVL